MMKWNLMALFLSLAVCLTMATGCSSQSPSGGSSGSSFDTNTPDKLAESVFETLVTNNPSRFRSIAIAPKELIRPIAEKNLREQSGFDEEKIRRKMEDFEAEFQKRSGEIEDSWVRTRKAADKDGVIWESARFERAEYRVRTRGKPERKTAGIMIVFNVGGTEFRVYLDDCFELEGNWYCGDDVMWRGVDSKEK